MKFQKSKRLILSKIVVLLLTVSLLASISLNIALIAKKNDIDIAKKSDTEVSYKVNEREALTLLVTSPEYIDWVIDIRENRPTNFPVVSYFGMEGDEYVFSLRENNGVINANHGFYFINIETGTVRSEFE